MMITVISTLRNNMVEKMLVWLLLALAICLEVLATFLLKLSHGFEKWQWGGLSMLCYAGCFWVLAPVMKVLPLGWFMPYGLVWVS